MFTIEEEEEEIFASSFRFEVMAFDFTYFSMMVV